MYNRPKQIRLQYLDRPGLKNQTEEGSITYSCNHGYSLLHGATRLGEEGNTGGRLRLRLPFNWYITLPFQLTLPARTGRGGGGGGEGVYFVTHQKLNVELIHCMSFRLKRNQENRLHKRKKKLYVAYKIKRYTGTSVPRQKLRSTCIIISSQRKEKRKKKCRTTYYRTPRPTIAKSCTACRSADPSSVASHS